MHRIHNITSITKSQAAALSANIRYGIAATPFGPWHIAGSAADSTHQSETIIRADFISTSVSSYTQQLAKDFPSASLQEDSPWAQFVSNRIFATKADFVVDISLLTIGTPFQFRVWNFLLTTKPGQTLHYCDIARQLGSPSSARAVGTAVAQNRIAFLIPCHRVLPKHPATKTLPHGHFRWGHPLKSRLLQSEMSDIKFT